ncbi:hypothetical protein GCM10010528_04460 [Gordonia defluvii]|uniref:Uncharacterized protein n=1 Tax=Gordonia defluvii TaxID=283718 RepID=A0ABN3YCZ0_9ACTN
MPDASNDAIPVWTLTTAEADTPLLGDGAPLTPERIEALRNALAAFSSAPIVTLAAHPMPAGVDRSDGISLDDSSPLAKQLGELIAKTPEVNLMQAGETLYRMDVPSKVAAELGEGLLVPMKSKAEGIYSALIGSDGVGAQPTFMSVAGKGAAGVSTVTVAGPLVLAFIAAGLTIDAERKRRDALDRLATILKKLEKDNLDNERASLNGAVPAIEKATAVLLDRGRIGHALGIDGAVNTVETAIAKAEHRVAEWRKAIFTLDGDVAELDKLRELFPGIDEPDTEFYAHLQLARLAIALERQVLLLQAVEHAQLDEGNLFESFAASLQKDQRKLDELVRDFGGFLRQLGGYRVDRSHGIGSVAFRASEVDKLLDTNHRLRELPTQILPESGGTNDVAIEVARAIDGALTVFPLTEAE